MTKFYEIKAQANNTAELWLFGFIGNSVWDDINPKGIIEELQAYGDLSEIIVYINSEGGSVTAGNVIYNALKGNAAKVTIRIEGVAASMASVISMAGDNIIMAENALMMIHDPWTYADGNSSQLRKVAETLDKAKATMIASYANKTGLDEEKISELMTAETWMTASEALELGFIDQIGESVDMAACVKALDLSQFKNTPNSFLNQSASTGKNLESNNMPDKNKGNAPASAPADKPQTPAAAPQGAANQDDINAKIEAAADQRVKAALAMEDARQSGIRGIFKHFGSAYASLESECLADRSITKAQAQEKLLAKLGEGQEPLGQGMMVTHDSRDKMQAGFQAAIMARTGLSKDNASNEFRGYSLSEMARACLEYRGVSTRAMDRMEMVGAAFTHSAGDFPQLLQNIASKSMLKGWDEAPETFQRWTSKGILTDFKPTSRVDLNSFPSLQEVPAGAEYKYATIGERGETTQLATYGSLFSINRQTIINDDLNVFSKLPMKMGRAARRTIGNLVYAILSDNPAMSDGTALFHSDHNNLGTAGAISTSAIDSMRVKMAKQTDGDASKAGNAVALGITPSYLLVPEELKGAATVVMESETEIGASQNNSKKPNSVRNIAEVISDARIAATNYYLTANPAMFDTIEVSYLDGVEQPFLDQMQGWTVDGTQFKARIDAGVKALDFRTMARNSTS